MAQQATKLAVVRAIPQDSPETRPMHEEVCALAYSLWEAKGCSEGTPEEDWFRAENAKPPVLAESIENDASWRYNSLIRYGLTTNHDLAVGPGSSRDLDR